MHCSLDYWWLGLREPTQRTISGTKSRLHCELRSFDVGVPPETLVPLPGGVNSCAASQE